MLKINVVFFKYFFQIYKNLNHIRNEEKTNPRGFKNRKFLNFFP